MRGLYSMSTSAVLGSCMMLFGGISLSAFTALPTEEVLRDPSILEEVEPVDVVYTWVDGSDGSWKKSRDHWLKKTKSIVKAARKTARFRNHDELKYSLRSVYAFAPFVRHIFIVTSGQKPKWLADHPKITVVSHKEIFSHKKHLPTFNSIAIEANLHHIPGLANKYIYFNDDVFLGKPVTRSDFFIRPYKIKVFLTERKIFDSKRSIKSNLYQKISRNMASFLQNAFSRSGSRVNKNEVCYHSHTPFPMIKWIANITEKRFPDVFEESSSHKFRSSRDISLTNGLIPQYALRLNIGEVCQADTVTFCFQGKKSKDEPKLNALLKQKPMFFCIQDIAEKTNQVSEAYLKKFFESYYPIPAPWEKNLARKHK